MPKNFEPQDFRSVKKISSKFEFFPDPMKGEKKRKKKKES
jgi:hypothetical protein